MKKGRLLSAVLFITWGLFTLNPASAQSVQADKKNTTTTATPAKPAQPAAKPAPVSSKPGVRPSSVPATVKTPVANKDITGYWLTAQKATIVEFYKVGDKYNAKGVWSKHKDKNGNPLKDVNNPDKSKRNRNLDGIDLIWGLTYNPKTDTYEGGKIYQPNTGKTFNCKVKLDKNKNTMQVTGGVGFISKTLTWTRTTGIPGVKK